MREANRRRPIRPTIRDLFACEFRDKARLRVKALSAGIPRPVPAGQCGGPASPSLSSQAGRSEISDAAGASRRSGRGRSRSHRSIAAFLQPLLHESSQYWDLGLDPAPGSASGWETASPSYSLHCRTTLRMMPVRHSAMREIDTARSLATGGRPRRHSSSQTDSQVCAIDDIRAVRFDRGWSGRHD